MPVRACSFALCRRYQAVGVERRKRMSFAPPPPAVPNPWARILGALEKKVNRQSFDTWLKPTRFSHITGRMLFVRVPTPEFQHIGDRYGDLIQEALDVFHLVLDDVSFVIPQEDPATVRV